MKCRSIKFLIQCLLLTEFLSLAISAQSPQLVKDLTKGMPAPNRAVVERLGELSALPSGPWRVHAGDLAHGESVESDDSSWPLATLNTNYPLEAMWFRQWVEVPKNLHGYDLTSVRLWFQFHATVNGSMQEILYLNGRRVAMGEQLEPVVLFDEAKPGDKVLVAVKLLATLDRKHFTGSTMTVEFPKASPNPEDLREEILSATALLPVVSTHIGDDEATLDKAVGQVDLPALAAGKQKQFVDSLRLSQSTLEALKPVLHSATVQLTGNSHIDAAWLWPWSETVDTVKRTYSTALQLMGEYPKYTFTQSAAAYNSWLADKYPELNEQIKKRIEEGRWEIVGGMWVEPDLNMPDGESTARSLLIGKRWYKSHYGVDVRIGWNPDSFGYNWQLPQIYKKSGMDYFVTQKLSWNDTNKLPFKLFWWESPDGSKVLTYFPVNYNNKDLNPVRLSSNAAQGLEQAPGLTETMDLYGVGDHGGGPTRVMLDEGLHWMQPNKVVPKMQFGTAQSFFSDVEKKIIPASAVWDYHSIATGYHAPDQPPSGAIAIPTWKDELYLETTRGVFTTQAAHKHNMRASVDWTLDAEKYASLAWLDGNPYPGDELTEAWKKITFNEFHDTAAGSSIAVVYRDSQRDFDQVRWATNEISEKAVKLLAAEVDTRTAEGVPVLVFNSLAWTRSGHITFDVQMPKKTADVFVRDTHGIVLPTNVLSTDSKTNTFHLLVDVHNVPPMGYEVLSVIAGTRAVPSDLQVDGLTLENKFLRVQVDPKTGCIISLYSKTGGFETLTKGSCGNELQTFHDLPKEYDAWNIDLGTLDQSPVSVAQVDSIAMVEKGPMRGDIHIVRSWQSSKFAQDIVLYSDSDEVEVINDVDWHETHTLLKTAFSLSATSDFATYEIPFGTIRRPTTRDNSWEKARFEVPALRWADLGNGEHGFSLINDSKYGYDGVGNLLRLTLLRSPIWPDPDADRGHQHFRYALYPHSGDWKQALTVRKGYEFNDSLQAEQVEAHGGIMAAEHSFASVASDNVVLTAMKKAEDSDALILHMYEWAGKSSAVEVTIPPGATGATETNLMEQPEGKPLAIDHGRVTVPIKPYEILSLQITYPQKAM